METQKVRETKNKIKNAFLQLRKTKRIEKISIKEISDGAGVNRSTFYAHYTDIYDLWEKIEKEAVEEVKNNALPVLRDFLLYGKIDAENLPVKFILENRQILDIFFSDEADIRVVKELKNMMKSEIRKMLRIDENMPKQEKVEFALEYLASAQFGIIKYWAEGDMQFPIEDIAELVESAHLGGIVTYLKKAAEPFG